MNEAGVCQEENEILRCHAIYTFREELLLDFA